MQPHLGPYQIPEQTATVAHAAFPKGTLAMRLADSLGLLYDEADFAALYSAMGRPAEDPVRLALVSVLQFLEGLSDRQAADAVRGRIDWKYLLGLELTDPGFDFSILSEFRARLIAGAQEQVLFDKVLAHLRAQGLLKTRGRQRTDSTHVLGAIRTLNRLEFVIETMRHALNTLAVVAPDWIRAHVPADWVLRYDHRAEDYRLPQADHERTALAEAVGQDGVQLLAWIGVQEADHWLYQVPAIQTLKQVWEEQYAGPPESLRWRDQQHLPVPTQHICSPYDPEARWANKGSRTWVGYKVFLTETGDPDQPRLITHVATTPASTADETMVKPIHGALEKADLLPTEHLVDAGFVRVEHIVDSPEQYGVTIVGPTAKDSSWQAHTQGAFDKSQFRIDWERQVVICPMGKESRYWLADQRGADRLVQVFFNREDCLVCPARAQCTRAKNGGRVLTLQPRPYHEALQELRQDQRTQAFRQRYAARSGVECLFSQGSRRCDVQQARYRGQRKTHVQQLLSATAINLLRWDAWKQERPIAPTRHSRFSALLAA
jgi:transposase